MKLNSLKLSVLTLCAAAMLVMPMLSRAQSTTNAPAASNPAQPKHHGKVMPFRGNLVSTDTNAMSFVVGTLNFQVTSDTIIKKDGKPATLADAVVGQPARGAYTKQSDGTLDVVSVNFGQKKKAESTN